MAMHYWDDNVVSNPVIGLISPVSEEDRVQNAWSEICRVYFPNIANAAGERYQIAIQPYRGIGIPSLSRPDIIVVRFSPGPSLRSLNFTERDLLEIECKRPSEDTPSGWRDAIQEETDRLAWYSTEKSVFFGIAIGKKVIFFMWDHARNGSEFHIKPIMGGIKMTLISERYRCTLFIMELEKSGETRL